MNIHNTNNVQQYTINKSITFIFNTTAILLQGKIYIFIISYLKSYAKTELKICTPRATNRSTCRLYDHWSRTTKY